MTTPRYYIKDENRNQKLWTGAEFARFTTGQTKGYKSKKTATRIATKIAARCQNIGPISIVKWDGCEQSGYNLFLG